jgi:hypothetical protein
MFPIRYSLCCKNEAAPTAAARHFLRQILLPRQHAIDQENVRVYLFQHKVRQI